MKPNECSKMEVVFHVFRDNGYESYKNLFREN